MRRLKPHGRLVDGSPVCVRRPYRTPIPVRVAGGTTRPAGARPPAGTFVGGVQPTLYNPHAMEIGITVAVVVLLACIIGVALWRRSVSAPVAPSTPPVALEKPMRSAVPALGSVTFDASSLRLEHEEPGCRIWLSSSGDEIGLYFFDKMPNLRSDATSLEELKASYLSRMDNSPARLVELSIIEVSGCPAVRLIIKAPQQPSGMTYVGSITIPFRNFSFVIKAHCEEGGTTGIRDAIVFDRLFRSGKVTIGDDGKIKGPVNADSAEYDEEFPEHPLSRLRVLMADWERTCVVDPGVRAHPKFPLPAADGTGNAR